MAFICISRKLGDEWSVDEGVVNDTEAFTCLMYGQTREKSINAVRSIMLKMVGEDELLTTKSKVNLSKLPPCRDSLVPHISRVNHRVAIFKRADKPVYRCPNPFDPGQGWERNEAGILEPVWSCGPILHISLINLLPKTFEEMEEAGAEEQEQELEYDVVLDDDEYI